MAPEQLSARDKFKRDILRTLQAIKSGRLKIFVPTVSALRRHIPGSQFHSTPELFMQIGGGTDFDCPGGGFRLRRGDVCVMPAGVPHSEIPLNLTTPYEVVVCMQSGDRLFLQRAGVAPDAHIQASETIQVTGIPIRDAFRYLESIGGATRIHREYRKTFFSSVISVFLITILAELQRAIDTEPQTGSPLVVEAEKLARAKLTDPRLSIAGIAASLGCSADHLTRTFHLERGLAPKAWIARERVTMALELLADRRHNIAEVGWACGFNESSYFIRVFRKHAGITPRQFRLRLNKG